MAFGNMEQLKTSLHCTIGKTFNEWEESQNCKHDLLKGVAESSSTENNNNAKKKAPSIGGAKLRTKLNKNSVPSKEAATSSKVEVVNSNATVDFEEQPPESVVLICENSNDYEDYKSDASLSGPSSPVFKRPAPLSSPQTVVNKRFNDEGNGSASLKPVNSEDLIPDNFDDYSNDFDDGLDEFPIFDID